jgi:nicotinate-nucleotide adenylyltransferase
MKRRIGIYSGTFDPVHNGHIGFALRAADEAGLDQVVFIPEKSPRDKDTVANLQDRFELLVRATAPYDKLSVRLLGADRFSVRDTLPQLHDMFDDAQLFLLMGSDVVKTFTHRWDDLQVLFAHMALVIGLRRGDTPRQIRKLLKELGVHPQPQYTLVESPLDTASSTRVRNGLSVRDVPPEVSSYIQQHHLYDDRRGYA